MRTPILILVRHSSPEIVPAVPAGQWRLSEQGRTKCKSLGERLAPHHPDVIFTSTEPKASETARIVAQLLAKPFATADGLHEHDRANVPFLSPEHFEAAIVRLFQSPRDLVFGRETADQAHRRFVAAIDAIIAKHPAKNVAVVTHGTVIALFVARAAGLDPFPLWKRLDTPAFVVLSLLDRNVLTVVEHV